MSGTVSEIPGINPYTDRDWKPVLQRPQAVRDICAAGLHWLAWTVHCRWFVILIENRDFYGITSLYNIVQLSYHVFRKISIVWKKVLDICCRIWYSIKAISQRQAQNRKVWFRTAWFFKKEFEKSSWQTLLVLIYWLRCWWAVKNNEKLWKLFGNSRLYLVN